MPLESLIGHIDVLVAQVNDLIENSLNIPYLRVEKNVHRSGENYINGLRIAKEVVTSCIVERANQLSTLPRKHDKRVLSPTEIIRRHWLSQVKGCYLTVERFHADIVAQANSAIPSELSHWLYDYLDKFALDLVVVLQESNQFTSDGYEKSILDPLKPMLEVAKQPLIPGSLITPKTKDIAGSYPIKSGYIISFVRGEAHNPLLWPLLIHETFHIIDREKRLTKKMLSSRPEKSKKLPILHKDKQVNKKWISEILADLLSIHSFGPMYALSLKEHFENVPYIPTIEHPEMSVRLYCVLKYLQNANSQYTNIMHRCINSCKGGVRKRVAEYEKSGELPEEKKERLDEICKVISDFFPRIGIDSFERLLQDYVLRSRLEKTGRGTRFVPFPDLVFSYEEIRDLILDDGISLAIHPNILLNVILSNLDRYDRDVHFEVLVDGIKKWKILETWKRCIQNVK